MDICEPHRKHLFCCQECVFIGPLPSNGSTWHDISIIYFEVFTAVTAEMVVFWFVTLAVLKADADVSEEHVSRTFGVEVCIAVPMAMTALRRHAGSSEQIATYSKTPAFSFLVSSLR
jgi:hypothetical protein